MKLSYIKKRTLYEKGYVIVPNVIPKIMIDEAIKAMNHSLGHVGMTADEARRYSGSTFCPEITKTPVITDLFNKTPALQLAESVIGEGMIDEVTTGQVAIRFPRYDDPPQILGPHLDGMSGKYNGIPPGTIKNFTAILAVFLSDVTIPYAGNFAVWPGTHHQYEQYFREHGPESLIHGMPPIDMPEPEQVMAKAGDITLCHYQIAHSTTMNASPHPRYAVFFRLEHVDFHKDTLKPMTDIWLHWPGIRDMLTENTKGSASLY